MGGVKLFALLGSLGLSAAQLILPTAGGAKLNQTLQAVPTQCASINGAASTVRSLAAGVDTVHWGYYYAGATPNLVVNSGDTVTVETLSHHSGDAPELMIDGDSAVEQVFAWNSTYQAKYWRGKSGKGDGVHLLTGPIHVCGAEPGDVLQVDILDLQPRKNPATNKTYGINAAASWGYHFRAGFLDGVQREITTVYELVTAPDGNSYVAVPDYQFQYGNYNNSGTKAGYTGPISNCSAVTGMLDGQAPGLSVTFNNTVRRYRYNNVFNCTGGIQNFTQYAYPGIITRHPTGSEDYSIRGKFKVPVNMHLGSMGLAPNTNVTVDSVPPHLQGGNIDDRRIGVGATMYYPVAVQGALLSLGDAHAAMGDSELDGTGIETSINARLKITLIKQANLPPMLQNMSTPILENEDEYVIHGYTVMDPVSLPDPTVVFQSSSLDRALLNTFNATRLFVMKAFNLTEDQALTAITVFSDFSVSQVVDGNWGMQCIVPKWPFQNITDTTTPYMPKVIKGSSLPMVGAMNLPITPMILPTGMVASAG
jgi:acetamidase/formamidase